MPADPSKNFFFVHIMKTGGTSFAQILARNFAASESYPQCSLDDQADFGRRTESYLHVPSVAASANTLHPRIVSGHVPYATRELLEGEWVALTLLRHPVERTISYLKHCKHFHPEHNDLSLEGIYERPWFNRMFMENYQTKLLSMTADEAVTPRRLDVEPSPFPWLEELKQGAPMSDEARDFQFKNHARFLMELFAACTGAIDIDDARLRRAKQNLDAIEVVGVTEHYNDFLRQLEKRYQWSIADLPRENTGSGERVSDEFAQRIAADNQADLELYEYARSRAVQDAR